MDAKQALEQLKQAVEKTAQSAQEDVDNGVHPEAVARHLASTANDLPDAVKLAQVQAIVESLPDEHKTDAAAQLLRSLEAGNMNNVLKQTVAEMPSEVRKKLLAELLATDDDNPPVN